MRELEEALAPYGRALGDYFRGDREAVLRHHSTLGEHDDVPVEVFFREEAGLFPFERVALRLCRGSVLDFGAGTGVHSSILQERGLEVTAAEIVPEAVEILRARSIRRIWSGDVFEMPGASFDTVLMLMNGVGPTGTLDDLHRFLVRAVDLVSPGGQILLDSAPPRRQEDGGREGPPLPEVRSGYPGEAWIRLEYRGEVGPPFRELYVDEDVLARCAGDAGWTCSFVHRDDYGSFLAQLLPPS